MRISDFHFHETAGSHNRYGGNHRNGGNNRNYGNENKKPSKEIRKNKRKTNRRQKAANLRQQIGKSQQSRATKPVVNRDNEEELRQQKRENEAQRLEIQKLRTQLEERLNVTTPPPQR
ncbi:hypothetical protein M3Y96_01029400 [Aphelenchoides besseyi]|nr:hypothetical protein M3Y96_01029400 [Aphelenchoides besseyi]